LQYLPAKIAAGLTLEQTIRLPDYPASSWTLSVVLRGIDAIDLTATADGDDYLLKEDATTTGGWSPGQYWVSIRVTDGTDVLQVEEGNVEVLPDLADKAAGYDGRTHAEKVLEAIEAVIESRATKDQRRYRVNNRELERQGIDELLRLRDRYRDEVRRQKMAAKGQSLLGRPVRVRF